MKKGKRDTKAWIQFWLRACMGAAALLLAGRWLYRWWDASAHPGTYLAYTAPWYVYELPSTILAGIVCLALALAYWLLGRDKG